MKKLYVSLISVFAIALGNAQVIYTDVAPDVTYTITDSVEIDINNNGSVDVKIFAKNLSYTSALGYSISTNSIYATNGWTRTAFLSTRDSAYSFGPFEWNNNPYYYPKAEALNYGDTMCGEPRWFLLAVLAENGIINGSNGHRYGNFLGQTHKYLCGWTIDSTNSSYNYWIGLGTASDASSFTLRDYGFEASGACLLAGEGSPTTGVKTNIMEAAQMSYFENELTLSISNETYANGTLSIYDLNGKLISSEQVNQMTMKTTTGNLTPGMYIASYTTSTAGKSLKFVVK